MISFKSKSKIASTAMSDKKEINYLKFDLYTFSSDNPKENVEEKQRRKKEDIQRKKGEENQKERIRKDKRKEEEKKSS